ncbi:MAG: hypothetical protein WCQ47_07035, partial [bacterium]
MVINFLTKEILMPVLRSKIITLLNELKVHEEGMRFQALAVILAKQTWPELIAQERRGDLGADAISKDKALACSITADLSKIKTDAEKIKKNYSDVKELIFATSEIVTGTTAKLWRDSIQDEFGYNLIIISREEIISSLMDPKNASLCRSFDIEAPIEPDRAEIINKVRDLAIALSKSYLDQPLLLGKPLLNLNMTVGDKTEHSEKTFLSFNNIKTELACGRRIILEAPAGRGKTTTLIQLANKDNQTGNIYFYIDLSSWFLSGLDILGYIAQLPNSMASGVDAQILAQAYEFENFSFLLNGWNEISNNYSEDAFIKLQQLERNFPKAGIIIATRNHYITPPLPGSLRIELLPFERTQRNQYLDKVL